MLPGRDITHRGLTKHVPVLYFTVLCPDGPRFRPQSLVTASAEYCSHDSTSFSAMHQGHRGSHTICGQFPAPFEPSPGMVG